MKISKCIIWRFITVGKKAIQIVFVGKKFSQAMARYYVIGVVFDGILCV